MTRSHARHLDDGELFRLLAGELDPEEQARADAHLDRCDTCVRSLDTVRERADTVRALIDEIDVPPVPRARRERSLEAVRAAADSRETADRRFSPRVPTLARAAAVASLLFATAVVATPAGSWIAGVWDRLTGPEPVEQPRAPTVSARSSVVAFVPRGDRLTVSLGPQREGTVTVEVADTRSASVRVSEGGADVDVTVLPASVIIDNRRDDRHTYTVTVPARLAQIDLRIGTDRLIPLRPGALGPGWRATYPLEDGKLIGGGR